MNKLADIVMRAEWPTGSSSFVIFVIAFVFGLYSLGMLSGELGEIQQPWLLPALAGGVLYYVGLAKGIGTVVVARPAPPMAWLGIACNAMFLPFLGPAWWLFVMHTLSEMF